MKIFQGRNFSKLRYFRHTQVAMVTNKITTFLASDHVKRLSQRNHNQSSDELMRNPTMTRPQVRVAAMTLHWLLSSVAAVNPVHPPVTAGQAVINLVTFQDRKRLFLGFTSLTMVVACTATCAIDSTPEATTIVLRCLTKCHACRCIMMYFIGMPVATCMLQQFTWNKNAWLQKILAVSKKLCEVLCKLKGWQ